MPPPQIESLIDPRLIFQSGVMDWSWIDPWIPPQIPPLIESQIDFSIWDPVLVPYWSRIASRIAY